MSESLSLAEALANFHFLRPWWLLALIPAAWFMLRLWRRHAEGSAWQKAIDKDLLPYLLDGKQTTRQRSPLILLSLAWLIGIIALAGPAWDRIPYPAQQRQDAVVLVVDQTLSMFSIDQNPNRQTVLRRKLMDILDHRQEGQTGLVVYAGEAHMVSPLTEDMAPIRNMVPALSPNIMPAPGNNPAHGIELAIGLLQEARSGFGRILLFTGDVPDAAVPRINELLSDTPYLLSVIGVGTERGAPIPAVDGDYLYDNSGNMVVPRLERSNLQALARANGGRYHDITLNETDFQHVLSDSMLPADSQYLETDQEYDVWNDFGPWLVLLILPFGALIFRRGWLLGLVLAGTMTFSMLMPTAPAHAFDLRSLWKTRDQQGAQAWQESDHERAAELFESSRWRGAAQYRSGNYEAAIESFAQGQDADSIYNTGNALAYAGRLQDAIAAYDAALAIEPDHEDALHNKRILEELLEQQEQETESDDSDQSEEGQEEQQDESDADSDDENDPQSDDQDNDQERDEDADQQDDPMDQQSDDDGSQDQQVEMNIEEIEDQESLEQWLRRIEDNPGELLERKFRFEHRRRQIEARAAGRQL